MWILIVIAIGGYGNSSPSVSTAEFENLDACQAAQSAVLDMVEGKASLVWQGVRMTSKCVSKGRLEEAK